MRLHHKYSNHFLGLTIVYWERITTCVLGVSVTRKNICSVWKHDKYVMVSCPKTVHHKTKMLITESGIFDNVDKYITFETIVRKSEGLRFPPNEKSVSYL